MANSYPFMTFEFKGRSQSNYLLSGVLELWSSGAHPLAALICFTSILAPIVHILGMLYVLAPLRLGHRPPGLLPIFRGLDWLKWSPGLAIAHGSDAGAAPAKDEPKPVVVHHKPEAEKDSKSHHWFHHLFHHGD